MSDRFFRTLSKKMIPNPYYDWIKKPIQRKILCCRRTQIRSLPRFHSNTKMLWIEPFKEIYLYIPIIHPHSEKNYCSSELFEKLSQQEELEYIQNGSVFLRWFQPCCHFGHKPNESYEKSTDYKQTTKKSSCQQPCSESFFTWLVLKGLFFVITSTT